MINEFAVPALVRVNDVGVINPLAKLKAILPLVSFVVIELPTLYAL